jgi:hypothetical protein
VGVETLGFREMVIGRKPKEAVEWDELVRRGGSGS